MMNKAANFKTGDYVKWNSSGGTAKGRIEHTMREGVLGIPGSSFSITATEEDPAALIRIYRDGEETETLVGHKFSTLTKISKEEAMKSFKKIFHIGSVFKSIHEEEDDDDLIIQGMASTDDKDRAGDIISPMAWKKGLEDYKKNPIILFNHDYNRPIGRAVAVNPVGNGLELKAKISKGAGEIAQLIKDGVLGAFSVGFMVRDADYDSETETFLIKQAELLEVSVVSVPANQAAVFSVQKSFDSEEEYKDYIKSFKSVNLASGQELADKSNDALASATPEGLTVADSQEIKMDPKDIQTMIADAVKGVSKDVAAQIAMQRAEEKAAEEAARKAAEEVARKETAQKEAIVSVVKSNAEELLKDMSARFAEKEANFEKILGEFRNELNEKAEELNKIRANKHVFADRSSSKSFEQEYESDIVDAHLLGVVTKKGWSTRFGKQLLEKATNDNAGVRAPASTQDNFETIVSTAIERDIQLELVLAPLFREIQMSAASMVIPTLPDANYAEFVENASSQTGGSAFKGNLDARSAASPGVNAGITLGSKVLTVNRIISKSYIANEVEEDAILPILPLIRESMVRSHARTLERSILLANSSWEGTLTTPAAFRGLVEFAVADSKTINDGVASPATVGVITAADLLAARQLMGKYGRRPGDVVYVVSLDAYYQLLSDAEFQNLNDVGQTATKIRGEIGQVFGSPVIVCDEFPTKANGAPAVVAVNPRNFIQPVLRGATVESDYDVEYQRRVLVATQRRGFDRMFADAGQVVAVLW